MIRQYSDFIFFSIGLKTIYKQKEGMIYSPNFMNKLLNRDHSYTYQIQARTGERIYLAFSYIYFGSDRSCSKTSISIYEGINLNGKPKEIRCGGNTADFMSSTNIVTLKYINSEESSSLQSDHGFKIYYISGMHGKNIKKVSVLASLI